MRLRHPLSRTWGCKRSQGVGLENFPGSNASVRANPTSPVGIRQGFCPGRAARARTELHAPRCHLLSLHGSPREPQSRERGWTHG